MQFIAMRFCRLAPQLFVGSAMLFLVPGCGDKQDDGSPETEVARTAPEGKSSRRATPEARSPGLRQIRDNSRTNLDNDGYHRLKSDIAALDKGQLLLLLEETSETRGTPADQTTFKLAIAELASRDPVAALAWFSPEKMSAWEPGFLEVSKVLAASNPALLKEWLDTNLSRCSPAARGSCTYSALSAWSETDPEGAFSYLSKAKLDPGLVTESLGPVFFHFGRQDPQAALAMAKTLSGRDFDQALRNISMGASEKNPEDGIEIAFDISNANTRGRAISEGMKTWMAKDPDAALKMLQSFEVKDLQSILAAAPGDSDSIVNVLGQKNPAALCDLLGGIVATDSNREIFESAIQSLVSSSPESAVSMIDSLPAGELKHKLLGSQFTAMARSNPGMALANASNLDEASKARAYASIGAVVGSGGTDPTLELAATLPEKDRGIFLASALPSIIGRNPKEAALFLSESDYASSLAPDQRHALLGELGSGLNRTDAAYAKQWLAELPGDDQPHAMSGIASDMARNDIQGLAALLGSMPADKNWETGVRVLIRHLQGSDKEMAERWQEALAKAGYK